MASNLTRFDPFSDIARFEPFRTFDEMFRDFGMRGPRDWTAEPSIRMDVTEHDNEYLVKAEIPGAKKEDIKVNVDGNKVHITAELKQESQQKEGGRVLRTERFYGQQSRSFTLAQDIDETQVSAKYAEGVLELTLPKKAGNAPRQVTIN